MLKLTAEIRRQLDAHGAASYPNEGCGLLLGRADDGANTVEALFPVANGWENGQERRARFRIRAEDVLAAELAAAGRGLDVVGVFHSHPDHPPVASPRDLAWAAWPGYSYVITEVRRGRPLGSRSWQLLPDRSGFTEEEMCEERYAHSSHSRPPAAVHRGQPASTGGRRHGRRRLVRPDTAVP